MPEVSVIIPNYNHSGYLQQRIDSVLDQTFQDFEVIILDDCSTDNSKDIIEQYRRHVKVKTIVYNEVNSGSTFRQWMKGIELANGNYIWIAESDDWCEPTFLEHILPPMLERPDCVIGYCQAYCVVGNVIKAQSSHPLLAEYIEGKTFFKEYMVSENSIYNASMAVWKKAAFSNVSHHFTTYRYCGDWLFWIEMCVQGTVFITGRILDYFRKHDDDVSGKVVNTGHSYVEEVKLLNTIYSRKLIPRHTYQKQLSKMYLMYNLRRKSISPEIRKNIMDQFTSLVSYAYLTRSFVMLRVKYKGYNLLKSSLQKRRSNFG